MCMYMQKRTYDSGCSTGQEVGLRSLLSCPQAQFSPTISWSYEAWEHAVISGTYCFLGGKLSIHSCSQKEMFLFSNQFWRCFWKNDLKYGVNVILFSWLKRKKKSHNRNNTPCEVSNLQTTGKTKPASQRYKKNINFYLMLPGRLCKQI